MPMYYTITNEDGALLIWFKSQYQLNYKLGYQAPALQIFFPYMSLQAGFEPEDGPISISTNYNGLTADLKLEVNQRAILNKIDPNTLIVTII